MRTDIVKGSEHMNKQFLKIPFNDEWLYRGESYNKLTAWVDLVMNASQEDTEFKLNNHTVIVGQGQVITSIRACAFRWNWSKDKVSNFFKQLEKEGLITKDSSKEFTIITFTNFENILILENRVEKTIQITEENLEILKDEEESKKTNKPKKIKENSQTKINEYYEHDELNKAFKEYVEMRKKIKKPMTPRAINLAMNKLEKLATNDIMEVFDADTAIKILEQSIFHSWQGLFKLKDENLDWGDL